MHNLETGDIYTFPDALRIRGETPEDTATRFVRFSITHARRCAITDCDP